MNDTYDINDFITLLMNMYEIHISTNKLYLYINWEPEFSLCYSLSAYTNVRCEVWYMRGFPHRILCSTNTVISTSSTQVDTEVTGCAYQHQVI